MEPAGEVPTSCLGRGMAGRTHERGGFEGTLQAAVGQEKPGTRPAWMDTGRRESAVRAIAWQEECHLQDTY